MSIVWNLPICFTLLILTMLQSMPSKICITVKNIEIWWIQFVQEVEKFCEIFSQKSFEGKRWAFAAALLSVCKCQDEEKRECITRRRRCRQASVGGGGGHGELMDLVVEPQRSRVINHRAGVLLGWSARKSAGGRHHYDPDTGGAVINTAPRTTSCHTKHTRPQPFLILTILPRRGSYVNNVAFH